MHTATNTTHKAIARHGWVALQRAMRTVSAFGFMVTPSSVVTAEPRDGRCPSDPGKNLIGP